MPVLYGDGLYGDGSYGGFTEFQGSGLSVQLAFGADLTDPDGWTWTDVTTSVRIDPGISTFVGRNDESSKANPASCSFVLDNGSGEFSFAGPHNPYIRRNTPIRVRVGEGMPTIFLGYADGFTPGWDSLLGIPVVNVSGSGILRRLAQGSAPLKSSFRRAMEADTSVVAYWPFEEGKNSTVAPVVRGGSDFSWTGDIKWDTNDEFDCSDPLPEINTGALQALVHPYTGDSQLRFLMKVDGLADATVIARVHTTGTIARWDLTYEDGGDGDGFGVRGFNSSNAEVFYDQINFHPDGQLNRYNFNFLQDGADIEYTFGTVEAGSFDGSFWTDTVTGTAGIVTRIEIGPNGDLGDTVIGHVTLQNETTSFFDSTIALSGYASQTPAQRLIMVCEDNGLDLTVYGTSDATTLNDQMGGITKSRLLELLNEVEASDYGQLWDGLDAGVGYTTRRRRSDGDVSFTLAASDLLPGFSATDDDQRTRNKMTVTRVGGVTVEYEQLDGPNGTGVIGIYDDSAEVSKYYDQAVVDHASWAVALGTTEGYRYPSLSFLAVPEALEVKPGFRVTLTNDVFSELPDVVDLTVEGISHEMNSAGHYITFQCSPFFGVARAAEDEEFDARLDTDGSTLADDYSAGATSIEVTTASGPEWTEDSDDYPMDLSVGGLKVVATGCSSQVFTIEPLGDDRASGSEVRLFQVYGLDY